ncbi:MAG: hypothetical protein ACP5GU_02610, partial [Thermoprotei archaeon]
YSKIFTDTSPQVVPQTHIKLMWTVSQPQFLKTVHLVCDGDVVVDGLSGVIDAILPSDDSEEFGAGFFTW